MTESFDNVVPDTDPIPPTDTPADAAIPEAMSQAVLAADLGGTFTKFGVVGPDGTLHSSEQTPTPVDRGSAGLVEWLAHELRERATVAGVTRFGVAVPGIVDEAHGVVVTAPNVGWREIRLAELLEQLSGLSGVVTHDVRAGGIAEMECGAGRGAENVMFVPIGTGIAAAVMIDGRMIEAGGYAGEFGHIRVPSAGDLTCACGQIGCLETIAAGPGLRRHFQTRSGIDLADAPTAEVMAERARGGDVISLGVIETAARALGEGLVVATTLYGSERIILGGGVSGMFDLLAPQIQEFLDQAMTFQRRPIIVQAQLGSRAGVVGAGLCAWKRQASWQS